MDSLKATEEYSAVKSTHPRVSLANIEDAIIWKTFIQDDTLFTCMGHASINWNNGEPPPIQAVESMKLFTICLVVMRNGFVIIGKSAPASPENFDAEKGRTFAYEDAVRQLWPLMGYELKERLYNDHAVATPDEDIKF